MAFYVNKIYNDILTDLSLDAESVPCWRRSRGAEQGGCCASMNSIIATLPDTIPTAHIISSQGGTAKDEAHFDSPGIRELGRRYAEKMLSLMGMKSAQNPIRPGFKPWTTSTAFREKNPRRAAQPGIQRPTHAVDGLHRETTGNIRLVVWRFLVPTRQLAIADDDLRSAEAMG
jgi:hypothetical protein